MLPTDWEPASAVLGLALALMLALLVWRAIARDRREYARFKRYRSTKRRQAMYRKWLRESFLTFGTLTVVSLLLGGSFIEPLLARAGSWPPIGATRDWMLAHPVLAVAIAATAIAAVIALTIAGILSARKEGQIPAIGDIRAMLPRNRAELSFGALLSLNAGVFEELVFRLGIPAMLFGATGNAVIAVVGSVLLFGGLHAYQGIAGVIGTSVIGALLMLAYLLSGSILLPIVLHVLFDLRTMVLIPMTVFGVHRERAALTTATRTS